MTQITTTEDFIEDYVGVCFIIALIVVLIGLLIGTFIFEGRTNSAQAEKNLYLALTGAAVVDSSAPQAAGIIRGLIDKPRAATDWLNGLNALSALNNVNISYSDLFSKRSQEISALVNGKIKIPEKVLSVPEWSDFWRYFFPIAWLIIAVLTTIELVAETIDRKESLLTWPWKRVWVYPAIIFMSPALLPCMAIEAAVRLINFLIDLFFALSRTIFSASGRPPGEHRPEVCGTEQKTSNPIKERAILQINSLREKT